MLRTPQTFSVGYSDLSFYMYSRLDISFESFHIWFIFHVSAHCTSLFIGLLVQGVANFWQSPIVFTGEYNNASSADKLTLVIRLFGKSLM